MHEHITDTSDSMFCEIRCTDSEAMHEHITDTSDSMFCEIRCTYSEAMHEHITDTFFNNIKMSTSQQVTMVYNDYDRVAACCEVNIKRLNNIKRALHSKSPWFTMTMIG